MITAAAVCFAASLMLSLTGAAARSPRLVYEAPASCPSEAEFVGAVAARGRELVPAGETDAARVLVVAIRHLETGFGGTFSVRDSRGSTAAREVRGESCAEVADALAVVTAIELDPNAAKPDAPSSSSPSPSSPPLASPDAAASPAARGPGEPLPAPEVRLRTSMPVIPASTEIVRVGAGDIRFDRLRSVSVLAGAALGFLPGVFMPRYDLQLTGANFVTMPGGAQRIAGAVLQIRGGLLGRATYVASDGHTTAIGASFAADVCHAFLYDSKGWVLLFCGEYGGGFLSLESTMDGGGSGTGSGTATMSRLIGFGQIGAGFQAAYDLGAGLELVARFDGGAKFGDVIAERRDGSRIFTSPAGYLSASFGLGYRF